ncbi:MAG: thioredoxin-disulfide reductase [Candidatus Omnitrophota bacterium]
MTYDLIIIGAGTAGMTAGIYAGRFRLHTLILEKICAGGQIITSPSIENFPGFPGGIATQELVDRLKKQVDDLDVAIKMEEVYEIIADSGDKYKVKTDAQTYEAKVVIIASGAQPKRLFVDGEDRLIGRGVSYCATCDAPLFRDKQVVVVGGGDKAIEEAVFLADYAEKVTVIHRRQELRASKILEEKAGTNPKINFLLDTIVQEVLGDNRVEAVKIRNIKTGQVSVFSCQGIFIFVGIKPNTDFVKNLLNINNAGFIITDQFLNTSRAGIFACGDCVEKSLYQVITGCSDGAVAADSAHKYLLRAC